MSRAALVCVMSWQVRFDPARQQFSFHSLMLFMAKPVETGICNLTFLEQAYAV